MGGIGAQNKHCSIDQLIGDCKMEEVFETGLETRVLTKIEVSMVEVYFGGPIVFY